MDCKKQYEKDLDSEKFLKRIKKIHDLSRLGRHRKPEGKNRRIGYKMLISQWQSKISKSIPLRITIINTNANQLQLQIK